MPSIVLNPTSINFPVLTPGRSAIPLSIALTTTVSTEVTLAISDAPPGVFVAELFHNNLVHSPKGGANYVQTQIATTSGVASAASGLVAPVTLAEESYTIQIQFASPSVPVPGEFTGTLVVSWPRGSASVALSGTTAQLSAKIATAQPITLTPGGMVKVPIDIAYASGDPTTVQVNVSAATFPSPPPAGITIGNANTTLSPRYVLISTNQNPKKGSSGSVPQSVLQTLRTAGITTSISAKVNVPPGSHEAYVSVTNPEFSQLDPAPLKIKFDVPPLPVLVKPPKHRIYLLVGESVSLQMTILAPGAGTVLEMGPMGASYESAIPAGPRSGPAAVTVAWPDWDIESATGKVQIGIGGGSLNVAFTLTSTDTAPGALGGVVDISLPWTAYRGVLKGTATFQINILPRAIQYAGKLNYAQLDGNYTWTLGYDGYSYYTGYVHVPWYEVFAQDYAAGVSLSATNPQGVHPIVYHSGSMGGALGTVFSDDSDTWADAGRWNAPNSWINSNDSATILSAWAELCAATTTVCVNYSPDAESLVLGFLFGILPVGAVFGGIIYFIENVHCTTSGAGEIDDSGDGEGDQEAVAGVVLNCSLP